ncbi:hypothetical protein GW17_00002207 [Ensete ventricosum]|nr:hypothetical protein GW17_00002207 [Ensete ventricosum]
MFFSSSSSTTTSATTNSYGEPSLNHLELCSAASPHGLFPDANGALPSSSPPCTFFSSESYLHGGSGTHSLPFHHHYIPDSLNQPLYSSSPSSSSCDYLDFNAGPVRRVLSTDNIQLDLRGSYFAFQYECRKTLADSRPRVRGRFARNGETDTEAAVEMETGTDTGAAAVNCFDNYEQNQSGGNGSDCWRQLQAALAMDGEDEYSYDEEFLANFSDFYSMNPL